MFFIGTFPASATTFVKAFAKRVFQAAAAAAALLCGAARADAPNAASDAPAVGVGMICNTSEQAEQFLSLRVKGANPDKAMAIVNKQAHDPRARGMAAIAFIRDLILDSKPVSNRLLQIVRINAVAGFNGSGWQGTRLTALAQCASAGASPSPR